MAAKVALTVTFGRKLLGSILQDLRKDAGLTTKFAADGPLSMRATMVRMIESGHADLPINKVHGYAETLNSKARGAWTIDPNALSLAYASLRSVAVENPTDIRFNWTALIENPNATTYVRDQLTRAETKGARTDSKKQKTVLRNEFEYLNSIQRQMVIDIARRISLFGSDIVTDEALAEWERQNAGQITRVLVATTSLGSELEPKFIDSITAISQPDEFLEWRYLLATADQPSYERAEDAFRQALEKRAKSKGYEKARFQKANRKFQFHRITLDQFRSLEKQMRYDAGRGWDGLYLYNVKYGQDLLIGAFRRLPSLGGIAGLRQRNVRDQIPALTPQRWGCMPVNEALRWSSIAQFTEAHNALWPAKDKVRV